ncbi:Rrf2 family transcriptional regulator [Rhodococcoides trifolii]|uniref:Rrf2 family transcriptional regulator n=1 Tax=Rhodococcoides trifolii TaxID=908250 RepID=A0A917G1Y3_9NOCA|nr:Rrf2 family transcriptional regulator [Rhodococcus trifolii]GGG18378.1 Rrf2 family transcriptional regulator [Rhodococcus trifolii]
MHITAKADTAVRALVEMAAHDGAPVKSDALAAAVGETPKTLEVVLADLRRADLVSARRGPDGGYWLTRDASRISIADVIRVIDGPLASVRGRRPEDLTYDAHAAVLQDVWIAVRTNIRAVLERVTIADVAAGAVPPFVRELTDVPGAWQRRR